MLLLFPYLWIIPCRTIIIPISAGIFPISAGIVCISAEYTENKPNNPYNPCILGYIVPNSARFTKYSTVLRYFPYISVFSEIYRKETVSLYIRDIWEYSRMFVEFPFLRESNHSSVICQYCWSSVSSGINVEIGKEPDIVPAFPNLRNGCQHD